MSTQALPIPRKGVLLSRMLQRHHGLVFAAATLLAAFVLLDLNLVHGFGYFDVSSTAASAATLALATVGATIVVIGGGLDLSVGAVISLTNSCARERPDGLKHQRRRPSRVGVSTRGKTC